MMITGKKVISLILAIIIFVNYCPYTNADYLQKIQCFTEFMQSVADEIKRTIEEAETTIDEIPEDWFDDAIFIGDSQTGALSIYTLVNGGLGNALIFHVNGLASHNIVMEGTRISFKGRTCTLGEVISLSGANKAFLMLAMNDVGTMPIKDLESCWKELLEDIRETAPDADIYIQSGTPISINTNSAWITKENTEKYNRMLERFCLENDCIYVNINKGLTDESGFLKQQYCRDNLHLNNDGCAVWVANLKDPKSYMPSYIQKG